MAVISFSREASKEEMGREIDRRGAVIDALTEERDRLALANAELKPLLQNIGDGIVNMFDQLVRGNWRDDHDHDVKMNVHMLNLQDVLKQILRFRADYLDYSEPNFDKHKATSTERDGSSMTGFLATMSEKQKQAAREYQGPDTHGNIAALKGGNDAT